MIRLSHLSVLCSIGLVACSEKQRQPASKAAGDSVDVSSIATESKKEIEVVAALVGYELPRSLPTGQTIPYFTLEPEEGHRALGFLFSVLEPKDRQGALFSLHHDGIGASGDPVTLYNQGARYRFNLNANDLMTFIDAGCSLRPLGQPVAEPRMSDEEAHALLVRYQDQRKAADDKIRTITSELNKEKQKPDGGVRQAISNLQSRMQLWKKRQEELERRIREIEAVQSEHGTSNTGQHKDPQQGVDGKPPEAPQPPR